MHAGEGELAVLLGLDGNSVVACVPLDKCVQDVGRMEDRGDGSQLESLIHLCFQLNTQAWQRQKNWS